MNRRNRRFKAVDNCLADGILQLALDSAAEISGAVLGRKRIAYQLFFYIRLPAQGESPLRKTDLQFAQHNIRDFPEIRLIQMTEGDDLIHPVMVFSLT